MLDRSMASRTVSHQNERVDEAWASGQTAVITSAFETAMSKEHPFKLTRVECRSATCVAGLTYASPADALQDVDALMRAFVPTCNRKFSALTPPTGPGEYTRTVIYDCRQRPGAFAGNAGKKVAGRAKRCAAKRSGRLQNRAARSWLGSCSGRAMRMRPPRYHGFLTGFSLLGLSLVPLGCSTEDDGSGAPASCSGLEAQVRAQATLRAYAEAVTALRTRALEVEAKFLSVCNAMNEDLGLDSSKKTAAEACGILQQRVEAAADAGVSVEVAIEFNCRADISVQADCEASCQVEADCDIEAQCSGGEVVVECNGQCSGQCDVTAPSVECMGTCQGSCSAEVEARCMGECQGSCSAPRFEGTCEAGCSAGFEGSCEGTCEGMCDGDNASGKCAGTCAGTCTGRATGSCEAKCEGEFSGGECEGNCSGSCVTRGEVQCDGSCNGTCSYEPGMATCKGTCHGECSAEVSPPTCTGELDCEGSAECHSSCQARASAEVDCPPPSATVQVVGDAELQAAISAHIQGFGEAVNLTLALKDPIAEVASKTVGAFEALGDIGVSGAACMTSSLAGAVEAEASISVSVEASASVSAG